MRQPRIPKAKIINGHKYVTSGFGYRSRIIALGKAKKLRNAGNRARVEHFDFNKRGDYFVVYIYDPREYYK